jgi:hypothetical protein
MVYRYMRVNNYNGLTGRILAGKHRKSKFYGLVLDIKPNFNN